MSIKIQNGERDFRKRACAEYCYIDPEYCPLCNLECGEETRPLKIDIRRWTDLEENTTYSLDYSNKLKPENCYPRETPQQLVSEEFSPEKVDDIPDYSEKIRHEHESFTPFSCWGDGSGFEYDVMPGNLVGPDGSMEKLYELSSYPIETSPLQLSDWNTWIDKYQRDYRFGQLSDQNAETILFPNVDDPWMFTEYVFKGVGSGEVIVEPSLYDEDTLELKNADTLLEEDVYLDDAKTVEKYTESKTVEGYGENKKKRFVKAYRQVCHWDELNAREDRRYEERFPVPDSGGRLYRVDVNVESVKWGEHGNVPPGTINMGAPADWMDVSKTAAKLHPRYVAHIGVPFYASMHGIVYWHNWNAFIDDIGEMTLVDGDKPYYTYAVKETGEHGVCQNLPKAVRPNSKMGRAGVAPANIYLGTGDLSHGGCQMLKGENGRCWCTAMDALNPGDSELSVLKQKFNYERCRVEHTSCPKYVGGPEFPILADYQCQAVNMAEYNEAMLGIYSGEDADERMWADNLLNNSTGLPTADMFVALGFGTQGRLGRPDIYNPTEVSVWYEAKFDVVYESSNPVQLSGNKSGGNGFGKGVQVIRGTGKQALDTYEHVNAFRGDTVFFGDMDQQSFSRWFETPMFCAKAAYCNDICGIAMQSGWNPAERAGSSEGKCKYYRNSKLSGRIGCPTSGVQKRAYEFQQTMKTASSVLLSIAEMMNGMTLQDVEEYNFNKGNPYIFEELNDGIFALWARSDTIASDLGGVKIREEGIFHFAIIDGNDIELEGWDVKAYLFGKVRPGKNAKAYFWYQSMDNAGNKRDVWFCKCDPNYVEFTRNTLIITNEEKFIGGYHPQYKDYSKMGEEYLQDVESDSYRDAMGDIIGDVDHDGQLQAMNKKGYWTDANGDYIVKEEYIGADTEIPDDKSRESNGSAVTISFKKSNTSINGGTGETEGAKTVNCAVHANDPFYLMEEFKKSTLDPSTGKRAGRPMLDDPNGGDSYWAPPSIKNKYALPTMRLAAHCPQCDYYISWRYHDLVCPWCGSRLERITGDRGDGMDVGSIWEHDASIMKKFFKLNAIGKVQVWAPPGTCVPKDGYYWKNPTVVTNTLIRQIKYRLGTFKDNGWQGDKMSAKSEFSLGYPEQLGYFLPTPDFESEKADEGEVYSSIVWKGVSLEERSRYSSYNDIMTAEPLPGFCSDKSNESVIVPYTDVSDDGLKMITAAEIRALRNRIEPILAYSSEVPVHNDFPTMRATFEKREVADAPRYMRKGHCRVPSVILATNDNGTDSYVQFWSGDYEWGSVREYYPPGMSWWWLNQVIGGRYSDLTGGYYHMDGNNPHSGGHRTVAKCAMFIHGILPLDKEILKAYAIISPAGEPYKEPIGRGWNGHIHYNHFHAMTAEHPNYGDGVERHLHGQAGTSLEYDENGDIKSGYSASSDNWWLAEMPPQEHPPISPTDESDYIQWSEESNKPESYHSLYSSTFKSQWTGLPGVRDEGFWKQYGTEKININNYSEPIYSYSRDVNQGLRCNSRVNLRENEDTKFKLIGIDNDGNLHQNYSTDEIWQNMTQSEMREEVDRSLVELEFTVSDGNRQNDITVDFAQYADKFITNTLPTQMQSIPGYFDFTGYNSEKRLSNIVEMSSKEKGAQYDKPIIIQEEDNNNHYSGGGEEYQAGSVGRIVDITELFKKHYNDRIERRFICSAGKSLSEASEKTFEAPKWEGVGNWDNGEKAVKWNSQEEKNPTGYLLNDCYSFPKLESDRSIPEVSTTGDEYPLAPNKIQLLCTFLLPFQIKPNERKYCISTNGEITETQELEIENERITTTGQAKELLEQIFSGYSCTIVSDSSCLIEGTDSIDTLAIMEVAGSCYKYFSIPTGVISGIQDRVVSTTSYSGGFYPSGLSKGSWWVTNNYVFETQKVVFDLARAPLEDSEKNYRYTAPTINCSSCRCPNADCSTSGMAVGVWAEKNGNTFGDGQTACPSCGTDLTKESRAVVNSGDGLYSWYYQEEFEENPFITKIEIDVEDRTSFRVSCRDTESSFWRSLVNVTYDNVTEEYTCYLNGVETVSMSSPKSFLIQQTNWKKARYVQIEVDPREIIEELEYNISDFNSYSVKVEGNFSELGLFDWEGLKCKIVASIFEDTLDSGNPSLVNNEYKIIEAVTLNGNETEMIIFFHDSLITTMQPRKVVLYTEKYTSTVKSFKVFGFHYQKSELTMTGEASEKYFLFTTKKYSYNLDEYPTQILDISIGKNDAGGIFLTEAEKRTDLFYNLAKKTVSVKGNDGEMEEKEIYVIKSGNYYFDAIHNRIYLPSEGKFENKIVSIQDLEKNIKGIKNNTSFLPTRLLIRYWSGSGMPITLKAEAEGMGPSYQLEKDTVTVIENDNLPDNGMSAKIPDVTGAIAKRAIPWCCYNHVPSTLKYSTQLIGEGTFMVPNLPSTALGKTVDNDMFFVEKFGENCRNILGKCETEVTFYGAPDKVLSGKILVKAPAYTTKKINTGDETVITRERTGGIKDGCLVFRVAPKKCKGRKTLAFSKPTIIVYAKERNPQDDF